MTCRNCTSELPEDALFCPRCGTPVSDAQSPAKEQAPHANTPNEGQAAHTHSNDLIEESFAATQDQTAVSAWDDESSDDYAETLAEPEELPKPRPPKIPPAPVLFDEARQSSPRPRLPFNFLSKDSPEELEEQIIRRKRRKILSISISIAVLLLLSLSLFFWWNSAGQRLRRNLNDNKLHEAILIYQTELQDKKAEQEQQLLSEALDKRIDDSMEKYLRGAITLDETEKLLADISAFDFYLNTGKITAAQAQISAREASRAAYSDGSAALEAENYVLAMEQLAAVSKDDPNYEQAQIKLSSATEAFVDKAITAADEFVRQKNFPSATAQIENALRVLPLNRELKDKLAGLKKAEEEEVLATLLREANQKASEGAYLEALSLLREDETKAEIPAVKSAIDIYTKQYVTRALRWAEEDLGRSDYDAAIQTLENALWNIYDDALQTKLDEVKAARPSRFIDLSVGPDALYSTGQFEVLAANEASFSSENMAKFSGTQSLIGQNLSFATYQLNGEFVRFTGSIVMPADTPALQSMSLLFSDQDGRIFYTSPALNSTTGALQFSIDVSGVQSMTIRQNILDILPTEHTLYIYDGMFYKQ